MPKKFFAMIDGEQRGPFLLTELADAGVTPDTYVWCKGMDDWQKARDNADICRAFRQRLFAAMHPSQQPQAVPAASKDAGEENMDSLPLPYQHIVRRSGTPVLPPNDTRPDYSVPPRNLLPYAIIVTLLCGSLLGLVAVWFAASANRAWRNGEKERAYELTNRAKMWIGITFFVAVIATGIMMMLANRGTLG